MTKDKVNKKNIENNCNLHLYCKSQIVFLFREILIRTVMISMNTIQKMNGNRKQT